jgi:hypothetical protein
MHTGLHRVVKVRNGRDERDPRAFPCPFCNRSDNGRLEEGRWVVFPAARHGSLSFVKKGGGGVFL